MMNMIKDKNEGVYQTNSEEIENIRMVLKLNYERIGQLGSLNFQMIAIVAAVVIGSFTLLGPSFFSSTDPSRYMLLVIVIHTICIIFLFWRFYAHYIDKDITKAYSKIIFCENKLDIPSELTLKSSLENNLKLLQKMVYKDQTYERQCNILQGLIDINRIGYRLHDMLDVIAGSIVILLLATLFLIYPIITTPVVQQNSGIFFIMLPIAYIIVMSKFVIDWPVITYIPIQRNPSEGDIEKIIKSLPKLEKG
jgi:hypothetical protein